MRPQADAAKLLKVFIKIIRLKPARYKKISINFLVSWLHPILLQHNDFLGKWKLWCHELKITVFITSIIILFIVPWFDFFTGNAFVAALENGRRAVLVSDVGTQYRTNLLQKLIAVLEQEESH